MSAISKITLPSGTTYDLHDSRVDNLNNWEYIVCTAAGNTPKDVTWGSVTGTLVASASTMYKIYLVPSTNGTNDIYDEYITVNSTGTTYVWEMFGNTALPDMSDYVKNASGHSGGTAKALAYKDSASGSFKPSGTVSQPTFTGSASTVTITAVDDTNGNYQPKGTVSKPSFTGSATTSTGKFTPSGSVALTNTNQSTTVSAASSGTATYTPAGSVAAPTISVKTAGTTASITPFGSAGTLPSATMPSYSVANETLTISAGSFSAGTLPSAGTAVTVKTGDATYQASAPSFTGTGARLVTGNISVPSSASFTGSEGNVSVSGTPNGSVSQPTFTGTKTQLSGSTTASGSVSQPTFTGTSATVTVS